MEISLIRYTFFLFYKHNTQFHQNFHLEVTYQPQKKNVKKWIPSSRKENGMNTFMMCGY